MKPFLKSFKKTQPKMSGKCINRLVTNGQVHHYHFDESIFIRGVRGFKCGFQISFHVSMKYLYANRIAPEGTQHSVASYLGEMFAYAT